MTMPKIKRIAVDLDNCIAQQNEHKSTYLIGPPNPGAWEFLKAIREMGYEIVIHSARVNELHGHQFTEPEEYSLPRVVQTIRDYLKEHDLPFDDIWMHRGKPLADMYVDDKAVHCAPKYNPDAFNDALILIKHQENTYEEPEDLREEHNATSET